MSDVSHSGVALPSERKFGLLFAFVGLVLALWGHYKDWPVPSQWLALFAGAAFLALALVAPTVLAPLNRAWFALGLMLSKVVSPVVMGLMFFLLVTPFALVGRWAGRDPLRLKKRQVSSYWIDRPAEPGFAQSFKNQF